MKKGSQIIKFSKEHYFLSNMYPCRVEYEGIVFKCAEAAFQAQKTKTLREKLLFSELDGKSAKKLGGKNGPFKMKSGSKELLEWNSKNLEIMEKVVRAKFTQNENLARKLVETNDSRLIEGNNHFDNLYGIPLKIKEGTKRALETDEDGYYILSEKETSSNNQLGKILMKIRDEITSMDEAK